MSRNAAQKHAIQLIKHKNQLQEQIILECSSSQESNKQNQSCQADDGSLKMSESQIVPIPLTIKKIEENDVQKLNVDNKATEVHMQKKRTAKIDD